MILLLIVLILPSSRWHRVGRKHRPDGQASAWSLRCPPVERAKLDHLCDPLRRVVAWLIFWLDDLSLDDLLRLQIVMITAE
ncbi:MAG TPA: hypothetical protein VI036_03895 [Propionibacteriaceae bacterium]